MNNQNCVIRTVLLFLCLGMGEAFGQANFTFTPSYGKAGDQVVITGFGYGTGSTVYFGAKQDTTAKATTATQITATVPTGMTLYTPVLIKVNGVYSQSYFTPIGTGPFVSSFTPTNGDNNTPVTIYGENFTSSPVVTFAGTKASSVVSTIYGQMTAYPPSGVLSGPIKVTTTAGSYTTTNLFYGHPAITGVNPSSGRTGTSVSITGVNLLGASSVTFNGTPAIFTVVANTLITALVPPGVTRGKIMVTTPDMPVMTGDFAVPPTVTDFSPKSGGINTLVIISGLNLDVAPVSVSFNGGIAYLNSISSTQLLATVTFTASSGPVTVSTGDGSFTTPNYFYFPPSINNYNPIGGPPGTSIAMTGYNFINATNVSFNGVSAVFKVSDSGHLTATVPVGASTGPISVSGPGGTFTDAFFFLVPPVITSFSPDAGVVGAQVQIFGNSFDGMTNVQFNGVPATFTENNVSQLTAIVPTNATTGKITLQATSGSAVSSANFRVDPVKLTIAPYTNSAVLISWPTSAVGFVLQYLGDLKQTNWISYTNAPRITNINNTVTNSRTSPANFYRLKK